MSVQPVLINGQWRSSQGASKTFAACNPATKEDFPDQYPYSPWEEIDEAITAAAEAALQMIGWPGERFARFLEAYAARIEARETELATTANLETAYPIVPWLKDVELPRTVNQLRQAADAAREGSWAHCTIDTGASVRSMYGPLGPVCVFGPSNFPYASNGVAG